jgi:hypothetical protein
MSLHEGGTALWDALGSPAILVFVAFVLLYAGVFKIVAPDAAGRALVHFHVMRRSGSSAARALGLLECALGALILVPQVSAIAAGAALVLFAAFAALLLRALVRGERFACACFGDESRDLDIWTVVRAAVLSIVAGLLAVRDVGGAGLGLRDVTVGAALLAACGIAIGVARVLAETRELVAWRSARP